MDEAGKTQLVNRLQDQLHSLAGEIASLPPEEAAELRQAVRQSSLQAFFDAGTGDMAPFPEENPNPVMRLSTDGILLYCNRAGKALIGLKSQINEPAPEFFQQLAQNTSPDSGLKTVDYEIEDRIYTIDTVPLPGRGSINIYGRDVTLRKQVESAREHLLAENQRQQALLDAIFDAEPSGLAVILGPDLTIAYANPAYRYLCPPTGVDITGQLYEQVWSGEVSNSYTEKIREALETGRPFLVEGFERHFPGIGTRIFTLQARRMQWGSQPAVLLILWDTTERSLSEAKYRDLAESITDNFVAYDKDMRCIFRNHASEEVTMTPLSEVAGKTFEQLYPELVGSPLHQTYLKVLETRQPQSIETEWIRPQDGCAMVFDVRVYPTQEGIAVISKDITADKQAELALRESVRREEAKAAELQAVMDAVPAVIWIARDKECREMISNRYGFDFLNVPEGTNISKSAPDETVAHQEFRNYRDGVEIPTSELPMQIAAATGMPAKDYEFDVAFGNGTTRTLYGNVVPLNDQEGAPAGAIGAFIDITGRKTTEQELEESQRHHRIIADAAADLLAGADPIARLNEFFQHFSNLLGLEAYVQYNLVKDHEGTHLELGSWAGFPEKYRRLLERLELGQAVCGTVAQRRERMIVEDVQNSTDRKTELIRKLGIRTYVCHPLIASGRLIGTLSFGSRRLDRLPAETVELLRTFCHLVASAMDRKQAEEVMQAHEKQYLSLLRNTNASFYEVDFKTQRFTYVNDAICLLSGYSREELLGMSPFDLLDETSQQLFRERIQLWLAGQKPVDQVEYRVRTKDGNLLYVILNVTFLRDAEGKPAGASVMAQDITEFKKLELALRQSEERFRHVLENSLDVAYRRDLEADCYDYMSPVVEKVLGHSVEEFQAMSIAAVMECIHPEDRQLIADGIEMAAKTGSAKLTYRFKTPSGTYRWIADYITSTNDSSGKPIYRTGILRDITEEVETGQQLKSDSWLLTQAGQMAHLGGWEVPISTDGKPLYDQLNCSDEVYRIFGYESDSELVPVNILRTHLLPDEKQGLHQLITRAVQTRQPLTSEFHARTKTGEIHTLQAHGEILMDEHGHPIKIVGAVQDITTLRELETNQLEYRTRAEVHRRLLEQREHERMQIARDLHDGPTQELIAATFAIDEIIHKNQDPDLKPGLEELQEKIKQQVNELRAFSGHLRPTALEHFGLIKAIQAHADEFRDKHPEIIVNIHNSQLGNQVPKDMHLALFRIYQEALNNITRHSQATQVDVSLKKENQEFSLVIEDNGKGFVSPKDWLELARNGHLGLVGMRERAEAVGGKLRISTQPGGGTRLIVEIPVQ